MKREGVWQVMDKNARIGRVALVHYKGGAAGGEAFDDHFSGDPERIVLGVGEIPKGMDDAFLEMGIGEERTVRIPCSLGFGEHDPEGVKTYTRTFIRNGDALKQGDVFAWTNPVSGMPIPVRVVRADKSTVTIDFNHPLAGKELEYKLQLVGFE